MSSPESADADAEPVPFDVTGALPEPATTTLLEASAGTGKTWTIAALVARMVVEGVAPLQQMLVVTFGRTASEELRAKVRARLVQVERAFAAAVRRDSDADLDADPLTRYLLEVGEAEQRRRWQRLRQALGGFDAATIATTHQFCQLVLKSLGVAGDTDTRARLVEDLDDVIVEVVDDLYLRGFAAADSGPAFGRDDALAIARTAVGDSAARLEPQATDPESAAARRRRFAEAVRAEVEVRKRRMGVLSYDDLLSQLATALALPDSPARERMRQRWSVVLVDEFQDTDPVQWQVLDRAFSGYARMVLIGDPKQAIYAFRGGDVTTYLQAAQTAQVRSTLTTNYRSDESLLHRLHALIGGAELGDRQILVRQVRAARTGSHLHGAPHSAALRLRAVDRARFPTTKSGPSIDTLRGHVARDLAADIRDLLDSNATVSEHVPDGPACAQDEPTRPVRASDVAVLCANRKQAGFVERALNDAGVPTVYTGSGGVLESQGAQDWLTLLEAIERPQITGRVRAVALTAFFGHTAASLDAGGDALTDSLAQTLRDWAGLLRKHGVAAVFEAASRSLSARVLSGVGGERLMTDLRHTAQVLHQRARAEDLGIIALVGWLREQMAADARVAANERTRRLDSDNAAVQIRTIHASKGQEFHIVYAPFLADRFVKDRQQFPLFHDDAGQRCLDVGGDPGNADHLRRAQQEDDGESLRLAYVALTRARAQVVMWWLPSNRNTPAAPLHRLLFGRRPGTGAVPASAPMHDDTRTQQILREWEKAGAASLETADPAPIAGQDPSPGGRQLSARRWDRHIDLTWRRTSYSALSAAAEALAATDVGEVVASEPEDPPRDDEPEIAVAGEVDVSGDLPSPMAGLPMGATFGSLVHQVLEHADPAAPEHAGDLRAHLSELVAQALVRWPVDLEAEVLTDALLAVIDSPLGPLAGTCLRQIPRTDRLAELDFELPLSGGDADAQAGEATLADLAPILRAHLDQGDPLLPYAEVVQSPAYAAQRLRGYLTGSVDVVLRVDGRYLVVDYKTNWLGPYDADLRASAYAPAQLAQAMTHSSYPLQALLYAVVLHRFLRWRVPGYQPEHHLGGVLYLYVRGMCGPDTPTVDGHPCGVFAWRPPAALVVELSDLLDGVKADGAQ
ncbi:MAG: UvrD-helicase domain-containing protein [Beutenbergiaceae bacterium]